MSAKGHRVARAQHGPDARSCDIRRRACFIHVPGQRIALDRQGRGSGSARMLVIKRDIRERHIACVGDLIGIGNRVANADARCWRCCFTHAERRRLHRIDSERGRRIVGDLRGAGGCDIGDKTCIQIGFGHKIFGCTLVEFGGGDPGGGHA